MNAFQMPQIIINSSDNEETQYYKYHYTLNNEKTSYSSYYLSYAPGELSLL
jgi:hypothetical protein